MSNTVDYEQSIKRLEEIVKALESGKLTLEESIKLFEEGTKLSALCYDTLNKAEQKITMITEFENSEEEEN